MSEMKEAVGKAIAEKVENGDLIGVGTGTTVDAALRAIKTRIEKESLSVQVVPSSLASAWTCEKIGLNVLYSGFKGKISWTFDGADEVDNDLRLIKGKGGALLQEKILAVRSNAFLVVVDESKLVSKLGENCAVPVEVVPEAVSYVEEKLLELGAVNVVVRTGNAKHGPTITEAGNIILDAKFSDIAASLPEHIKSIVGVVEHGIFPNQATEVWIASPSGIQIRRR